MQILTCGLCTDHCLFLWIHLPSFRVDFCRWTWHILTTRGQGSHFCRPVCLFFFLSLSTSFYLRCWINSLGCCDGEWGTVLCAFHVETYVGRINTRWRDEKRRWSIPASVNTLQHADTSVLIGNNPHSSSLRCATQSQTAVRKHPGSQLLGMSERCFLHVFNRHWKVEQRLELRRVCVCSPGLNLFGTRDGCVRFS